MSQTTVANRYAQAIFELALKQNVLTEVGADFQELKKVLASNDEFMALLNAPKISADRKKELVAQLLTGAQPILINAVQFLIEKKRLNELSAVVEQFQALAAASQGSADAKVYSTRELTAEERAEISAAFSKLVGKKQLNITNIIDASLIGGVRVQIGNYIFDSTVASKLEDLKRVLVG
ncbi:F0F1 ATP synthase subunit delta [Lysinibacillus sp. 2017]|uniref:F0F1 ATP synthase subunit delta n=1 Tax=unclassified Lysinibacillus TaxID=2636778 RepID=UPI000D52A661|nr:MULTISPECIES: F0F1 ATP synthase subunit delta [unclassified Lysinibacillus]AWE06305.1 F0F1 ATP synthase subunit delta [Lysinibacillus sp. 2017]TGN35018.1 F0F1 ATP synthase subunit delta [Lysinibacillus sp. S2017]